MFTTCVRWEGWVKREACLASGVVQGRPYRSRRDGADPEDGVTFGRGCPPEEGSGWGKKKSVISDQERERGHSRHWSREKHWLDLKGEAKLNRGEKEECRKGKRGKKNFEKKGVGNGGSLGENNAVRRCFETKETCTGKNELSRRADRSGGEKRAYMARPGKKGGRKPLTLPLKKTRRSIQSCFKRGGGGYTKKGGEPGLRRLRRPSRMGGKASFATSSARAIKCTIAGGKGEQDKGEGWERLAELESRVVREYEVGWGEVRGKFFLTSRIFGGRRRQWTEERGGDQGGGKANFQSPA